MTKQEKVVSILQSLGFKPQIDEEGDIFIRYQMKTFYVMNANSGSSDKVRGIPTQIYQRYMIDFP